MSLPAFAELLERLVFTPGRLAKLALIRRWFDEQPDPERGVGLAALTGELVFSAAKPSVIRALVAERTDPVLLALSQDYVGDFAETVALIWPGSWPRTMAPDRWSWRRRARLITTASCGSRNAPSVILPPWCRPRKRPRGGRAPKPAR